MAIAYDSTTVRDYVLISERELQPAQQTIWKLGVLDTMLRVYLNDKLYRFKKSSDVLDDEADISTFTYQRALEAIRFGLKGWENFKDKTGQDVLFTTVSIGVPGVGNREGLSDFLLKKINPDWVLEIGNAIIDNNTLDKEAEKK